MKRAYLAIVWGIASSTITGPYDTAEAARGHAEGEVREGHAEKGAVLGPVPIAYLDDDVEVPPALQATSVDQVSAAVNTIFEFAVNEANVSLRAVLAAIERDVGDWSENLEDEGGMPLTSTFGRTLADHFRPSELLALYEDCQKNVEDDSDRAKMVYIREAYRQLTGDEL